MKHRVHVPKHLQMKKKTWIRCPQKKSHVVAVITISCCYPFIFNWIYRKSTVYSGQFLRATNLSDAFANCPNSFRFIVIEKPLPNHDACAGVRLSGSLRLCWLGMPVRAGITMLGITRPRPKSKISRFFILVAIN